MPRPTKYRKVEFIPECTYYIPMGKPKCKVEEIILKIEELEAMRLKDIEGLNQEECADKMEISRQTFQNVIDSARKKVAIALTEGKAINIRGGHYTTNICKFQCLECGNIYNVKFEEDKYTCPDCGENNVVCKIKSKHCEKCCKTI